ncbi:MAG: hypothetical protein ACTHOU_16965, partial [Aureliella sp.]
MKNEHEFFRQQLLANEPWDSAGRQRYEQAIQELLSYRLTSLHRGVILTLAVALILGAVLFAWLAITQNRLPILARFFLGEGTLFTIAMVVYLVGLLRRGTFHRRKTPTFVAGAMWIFAIFLSIHFVALIPFVPNPILGIYFLGMAMLSLAGAGLQFLAVCIQQSE